jgi:hypothetical protein
MQKQGETPMTITNTKATDAYLHALNNMPNTRHNHLARLADRMAGEAFDSRIDEGVKPLTPDAMMDIETAIFTGLCRSNGIDWRYLLAA